MNGTLAAGSRRGVSPQIKPLCVLSHGRRHASALVSKQSLPHPATGSGQLRRRGGPTSPPPFFFSSTLPAASAPASLTVSSPHIVFGEPCLQRGRHLFLIRMEKYLRIPFGRM